ncbi:MAG: DsbA family protein [Ardenticatenaceae bacterium]|nr:DsbA family protein [Ardenticatenaceae bacterium]
MAQRVVRRKADQAKAQPSLLRRPVVLGAIALAAVVAIVAIILASRPAAAPAPAASYEGLPVDGRALGVADAPVKIVEYSDFQCPFCKQADETTVDPLKQQYIPNGQVRFEYQPVAFLGQESLLAAEAALCAEDQGEFWIYHDKLFASQAGENRGTFSVANLKRFAGEVGLNQSEFNTCLDSKKHESDVLQVTREAQSRGVTGTPTFFVNDVRLEGAVPFRDLQTSIERDLAK